MYLNVLKYAFHVLNHDSKSSNKLTRGDNMSRRGGRGRMGGPNAGGPGGNCICPNCHYREPHVVGAPCANKKCPKCGARMTRE